MHSLDVFWTRKCIDTGLSKIKSLAMLIYLDSKEVCVKLDKGLDEIIIASICFSARKF